jgi:hypothetical protein
MEVSANSFSNGVMNFQAGSFTSDGTDTTLELGFVPRWIKVVNSTDVIVWEKIEGMAAVDSIKTVTAGTTTIDTGSAIIINDDGTVVLEAATVGSAKAISWVAIG